MCVRIVLLSQPSSRALLYVKCLCVLSCYLSPLVELCYVLNVCVCIVLLSQPSSRALLYVKCVCVCIVLLSQPSSRALLYVKCVCVCVLFCYLSPVVELLIILSGMSAVP